jgi:hypothetical protein
MTTRHTRIIFIVGLLVAAAIYLLALTPYVGDGYDDGRYVALAEAIAQGNGYSQTWVPGNPPEPQYPPGWPVLLSAVWFVAPSFPANIIGFKLVAVLCALAFGIVIYGWSRWRGRSESVSALIVLLTLFNPLVLGYATSALSEAAYTLVSIGALWAVEHYARQEQTTWRDAMVPALLAACVVFVRAFGLALIAAALVYLGLRDRRKAILFCLLSIVLIAPWLVRGALLPADAGGYLQQFFLKSIEQPELGKIGIGDLIVRVVLNVRAYLLAGLPGALFPSQVPLTYVNLAEGLRLGAPIAGSDLVLACIVAAAVIGQMIFRRSLVDWYLIFYLALGLLWPWEPTRFVVPLIPLLWDDALFLAQVFVDALILPWRRVLSTTGWAMVALFIIANAATQARYAWTTHQNLAPSPAWSARLRLFDWIERNTKETDVLAAMNDSQVYLYTRRSVIRDLGSADALRQYHVKYVVLIPYGGVMLEGDLSRLRFLPFYRAQPGAFARVYIDKLAGIEVYQVDQRVLAQ